MSKKTAQVENDNKEEKATRKRRTICAIVCGVTMTAASTLVVLGVKKGYIKNPSVLVSYYLSKTEVVKDIVNDSRNIASGTQVILAPLEKTGKMLTATGIGDKMLVSAQEVNKRLIEKGLAKRMPYGVVATEAGAQFGKEVVKTTRYGHTFSNFEWDSSLIDILFSEDEFAHVAKVRQLISGISSH